MKRITREEKVYAFILAAADFQPGANFVSEAEWPLQVGLMNLATGHAIAAHAHLDQSNPRVQPTQEFLIVMSGEMEVDFFDETGRCFRTEVLGQGQALFQLRGGHAFRFLEPTRLIEVKSGPYLGRDKDKVMLNVNSTSSEVRAGIPSERRSM